MNTRCFRLLLVCVLGGAISSNHRSWSEEPRKAENPKQDDKPMLPVGPGTKEQETRERIQQLLAALAPAPFETPEQKGKRLTAAAELVKLGEAAVPQLVIAATGKDWRCGVQAVAILERIGKPALPHIRQKWGSLTDPQRW